jgi:hypothetical protein
MNDLCDYQAPSLEKAIDQNRSIIQTSAAARLLKGRFNRRLDTLVRRWSH